MSGNGAVALRRTGYPQVDPRAAGLMQPALAVVSPRATVGEAARLAQQGRTRLVATRLSTGWAGASRETLARAMALGLGEAPLQTVLWDTIAVAPNTPEVAVRRRLGPDCPFVLVEGRGDPAGVVLREAPPAPGGLPLSVAARLDELPRRTREILRTSGVLGETLGCPVAAVGGLVRDLLMGRVGEGIDLDLVVEGHAATLADCLAAALSGRVTEHATFLTATVALSDGRRIDLATARRESYRAPGALPRVEPGTLAEDLARRDFSLNALAVRLEPGAWGRVVDTTGGLVDLRARRIRVLHPLSFVEDPTRILRAARLSARLGCEIDRTTRRLARGAAALDAYHALSGDRLRAELGLALLEPRPAAALREAERLGAWKLLGGNSGAGPGARRLLATVLASSAREGTGPDAALGLALLALTEGGPVAETWAGRLGLAPTLRDAMSRARRDAPPLLARLTRVRARDRAYAILQGVPEMTLAWARALADDATVRRHLDSHLTSWRRQRPLATGDDLAALGVPAGPAVGALLRRLRARQAAGQVRTRAGALRWLTGAVSRSRGRREASLTRPGKGGG